MLNIAMVTDFYYPRVGGVEYCVDALARHLVQLGHKVTIITRVHPLANDQKSEMTIKRIGGFFLSGYVPFSKTYQMLRHEIQWGKFDIVHAHGLFSPLAMAATRVAKHLGVPHVLTLHSLFRGVENFFAAYMLTRVSKVIAVSRCVAKQIEILTKTTKVYYVPNGFDLPVLDTPLERVLTEDVKSRIVLGTVSRLTRKKEVNDFIWIAARILQKNKNLLFVIVGGGPERKKLEKLVKRLNIKDQVVFTGNVSRAHVFDVMRQMDVFALTCSLEAFGMVVLEAMQCCVPVVARDKTGISDIITSGESGYLCDSKEAMLNHITLLIENPDLRRKIAAAGAEVVKKFNWLDVANKTVAVYQELIDEKSLSHC